MPSLEQWFGIYQGIQNAINSLKGDLDGVKSALDAINTHAQGIEQNELRTISQTLKAIEDDLVTLEIKVKPDLSPLVDLLKQELVSGSTSFADMLALNLGHLSSTLDVKGEELNAALAPLALLVRELTKPGTPSYIEAVREYYSGVGARLQKENALIEAQTQASLDNALGALAKKGESAIESAIEDALVVVRPALNILETPFTAIVNVALKEFTEAFTANTPASMDKARDLVTVGITKAFQMGEAAHLLAAAAEMFAPLKQMGFPQLAAALGDLSGFKDISGTLSRSLIMASITRPLRWWGNVIFRPEIIPVRDLVELVHKRELDLTPFANILYQHGFTHEDTDLLVKAVWREPTIRDLAIAIEDTTIDDAWLLERVRKAGYEDADADQLQRSLIQRALKAARGRVISAALASVTDGLLDTESYRVILESLQLRQDEIDLQIRTAELSARRDTVNTAITTYKRSYINGQLERSDFTLALTALGVVPDRVDLIALDADAQRQPRIAREEEQKVKKAVREIQEELVPRYRKLFELGVIDEVAYENILIEAGVSTQVAAQAVLLDKHKRQIVTQFATAAALERQTAALVAETETALRLQFRKGLIDEDQLQGSLLDLGYSDQKAQIIVKQETARATVAPGREISAPAEAKDRVVHDLTIQTALNDFRKGRIDAGELLDKLMALGMTEAEALARVNLEISRLPATTTPTG